MVALTFGSIMSFAQQPTPLPLSQDVKHGQLPNGLNYYILHNEEPKERVNFYIAQKVGSTLENADQLGLAHFLEHMAFNGTSHYPGKNMLNYLQSKGIRFGSDINAYTGFDETVYNINNVPSTDVALMDSVLLVLSDWSGSILLEEDEINAERGVIESEWRSRNSAQIRMYESILPKVFSEYQYQQMPIGKMEVVRNFPPQAIRDYYHKWYRPDQQGIIIVGDIDVAEMEKKVIDLFSQIPMPENAAERLYPAVSDNAEPIYAYYKDKEMPYSLIQVSFKSDKLPVEMNNTDLAFMQEKVFKALISTMINNRLKEYSMKPECNYSYAGVSFGNFWVSKTKDAFDITIIAKDDVVSAYNDALSIVARACKTGFMQSELVRARDELLANYEKAYNEKNNTKSETLARKLIRTFIDNESFLGAEGEYKLMQQVLPMIPVQLYNQVVSELLTPNNQVIVVSQPDKDGMKMVSEEEMVTNLQQAINAEYEAYVDEELPQSLIEKMPKAGKISATKTGNFETTEFTLSNGVKVVVKPTDFQSDEILFNAYREGGKRMYSVDMANEVKLASDAVETSKLGKYAQTTVSKYCAGKKLSLKYDIGNAVTQLKGQTTVKDLPTLMELVYLYFTSIEPDNEAYQANISSFEGILKSQENNPQFIFQNRLALARANGNELFANNISSEILKNANYEKTLKLVKSSLANAADYTFIFTGNVNIETLKPLLEQYIASLPSTKKASPVQTVTPIPVINGEVNDIFDVPMEVPQTYVFVTIDDNNVPYSIENSVKTDAIGDLLDIVYTATLREEEGGTYSPQAFSGINPWTGYWSVNYLFMTNSDMQEKLIKRASDELINLLGKGANEADFNKVKEAMVKQYEINVRTNKYWDNGLMNYLRGVDAITNHKAAIDNMTFSELNAFMNKLYNGKNRLNFIMTGVPTTK